MTIVILQPGYLPWLGLFDQLYRCDTFVIYDDVQYDRRSWRNRNRIKTPNGPQWLTVPVKQKGRYHQLINETEIDNSIHWQKKHWSSIEKNYKKAPLFEKYHHQFHEIYHKEWKFLLDLDMALICLIADMFGLNDKFLYSSSLNVKGGKTDRLVNICKKLNASVYLTGDMAKNYMDIALFDSMGITIEYQSYVHPVYPQQYGDFIPYLSAIDLLFNCGKESLNIISGHCVKA